MRPTLSLIRREFSAYFYSPIAYVVLAVFLAVTGHLFYLTLEQLTETGPRGISYPMEIMVGNVAFWLVYLFIPPLLTMRLFAEERSTGTLEMLLTAPVRDWQVVFAKYIACFGFYTLMWLPTVLYFPILADWHPRLISADYASVPLVATYATLATVAVLAVLLGVGLMILAIVQRRWLPVLVLFLFVAILSSAGAWLSIPIIVEGKWWTIECGIDPWPIATTYLGLALAGAMFLSIGLFVSSLVNSQMIAAIVALFIGLLFIAGYWLPEMDTNGLEYQITFFLSVPLHFERHFSRGLIDTRHVILYGSVALFGLFLTIRSLESRRWR
jgi:ABC-2 type transport system permease protein